MSGSDPTRSSETTSAPRVLGRYHLGCELASGGMATVFLAIATDSTIVTRPLALKRIHPHLASEQSFVEMFVDEARIASRLHHPNLCGVLDFGHVDGTYFMTMEYLFGEPLSRLMQSTVKDTSLDARSVSRVAAQVIADACEGLHAAHELRDDDGRILNVVHRDITPSNLFVTYDGLTRVVDFGVASALDRVHHTSDGIIKGKLGYVPPEQLRGLKPDRRGDIWALGVLLWELLARRRLFRRESPSETMMATVQGHVPPIEGILTGLDPALPPIVRRATAKELGDRYASAAEMAADLQRFLAKAGEPSARREVAGVMARHFPNGERDKRALVRTVVDGGRASGHLSQDDSYSSVARVPTRSGVVRSVPARKPRRWVVIGALTAAIVGGVVWGAMGSDDTPDVRPTDTGATEPRAARLPIGLMDAPRVEPTAAPPPPTAEPPSTAATEVEAERPTAPEVDASRAQANAPRRATTKAPVRQAAPAGEGTVTVSTSGDWARVYFRGRLLGPTPGRFTLPAGRQTLQIRPGGGGAPRNVVVNVRPDQTVPLRVELQSR